MIPNPAVSNSPQAPFNRTARVITGRAFWLIISLTLNLCVLCAYMTAYHKEPTPSVKANGIRINEFLMISQTPENILEASRQEPELPAVEPVNPAQASSEETIPETSPGAPDPTEATPADAPVTFGTGAGETKTAGSDGIGAGIGASGLSQGFGDAIAQTRRNGLDVVFLFDSTGSMTHVTNEAKNKIQFLMDLLQALVPGNVRVGAGTFRDHGEEYVVKGVPLASDFNAVARFLGDTQARGGGDTPEAVAEALLWAMGENPWRENAEKVIILVGDAPAHRGKVFNQALSDLSVFHEQKGTANCLLTFSEKETRQNGEAKTAFECFRKISDAGGGETACFDKINQLGKNLLTMTFGSQYEGDIDQLYEEALKRLPAKCAQKENPAQASPDKILRQLRATLRDAKARPADLSMALRDLGTNLDEDDMQTALGLIGHDDPYVRYGAIKSLVKNKFKNTPALAEKIAATLSPLATNDPFGNFYAQTLADLREPVSVPALIAALSDDSLKLKARKALKAIAGKDFGDKPDPWRKWFDSQK